MKIRNGFVSNSSSSSFIIYKIDKNKTAEEIIKNNIKMHEYYDGEDYVKELITENKIERDREIILMGDVDNNAYEEVERTMHSLFDALENDIKLEFEYEDT